MLHALGAETLFAEMPAKGSPDDVRGRIRFSFGDALVQHSAEEYLLGEWNGLLALAWDLFVSRGDERYDFATRSWLRVLPEPSQLVRLSGPTSSIEPRPASEFVHAVTAGAGEFYERIASRGFDPAESRETVALLRERALRRLAAVDAPGWEALRQDWLLRSRQVEVGDAPAEAARALERLVLELGTRGASISSAAQLLDESAPPVDLAPYAPVVMDILLATPRAGQRAIAALFRVSAMSSRCRSDLDGASAGNFGGGRGLTRA